MPFTSDQLQAIDAAKEVRIETRSGDRTYHTVIWVVTEGDEVFVRSVRGEAGKWYQRALADSDVAMHVSGTRIPATALPATDPESVGRTTEALRNKYRPGASLDSMVRPEVLGTTLRLDRA